MEWFGDLILIVAKWLFNVSKYNNKLFIEVICLKIMIMVYHI